MRSDDAFRETQQHFLKNECDSIVVKILKEINIYLYKKKILLIELKKIIDMNNKQINKQV